MLFRKKTKNLMIKTYSTTTSTVLTTKETRKPKIEKARGLAKVLPLLKYRNSVAFCCEICRRFCCAFANVCELRFTIFCEVNNQALWFCVMVL